MRLGESIAVLDGFDLGAAEVVAGEGEAALALAAGGTYSGGSSWAPGIPTVYGKSGLADAMDYYLKPEESFMRYMNQTTSLRPKVVISASGGANYGGGSSYAPGMPLLPSKSGLAAESLERAATATRVTGRHQKLGEIGVIDASAGANYSGGSSYAPGLPLLPSTTGLADADLRHMQRSLPNFRTRSGVIDASEGGNYGGGSSYAPGMPLLPSTTGLAGCRGCGGAMAALDMNVRHVLPGFQTRSGVIDASDGGNYAGGASYAPGLPLLPSSTGLAGAPSRRKNVRVAHRSLGVIDASAGANYSGGSSYAAGLPLLPSSTGLAELCRADGVDKVQNDAFNQRFVNTQAREMFSKVAGSQIMKSLRDKVQEAKKVGNKALLESLGRQLNVARRLRRSLLASNGRVTVQTIDNAMKMLAAQATQ